MYKNLLEVLDRRGVRTGKPFFLAIDISGGMLDWKTEQFLQALERAVQVLLPSEMTIILFDDRVRDIRRTTANGFQADKFRVTQTWGGTVPEQAFETAKNLGATDLFVYTDGIFDPKFDRHGVNSTYLLTEPQPEGADPFNGCGIVLT